MVIQYKRDVVHCQKEWGYENPRGERDVLPCLSVYTVNEFAIDIKTCKEGRFTLINGRVEFMGEGERHVA